jgi:hypothetical protein
MMIVRSAEKTQYVWARKDKGQHKQFQGASRIKQFIKEFQIRNMSNRKNKLKEIMIEKNKLQEIKYSEKEIN